MNEPNFLRDSIVFGLVFVTLLLLGVAIGYRLAKARWYREGRIAGAAEQRKRDEVRKPLRTYTHNAA